MSSFGGLYVTQLYCDEMYRWADRARLVRLARRAHKAKAARRSGLDRVPVASGDKS